MISKLIVALALTQTSDSISITQSKAPVTQDYTPVGMTDQQLKLVKDQLGQSYYLLIGTWKLPLMKSYVQTYGPIKGNLQIMETLANRVDDLRKVIVYWQNSVSESQNVLAQLRVNNAVNRRLMEQLEEQIKLNPSLCAQARENLTYLQDNYLIDVAKGVEQERAKYLQKYELVNIYDQDFYNQDNLNYYEAQEQRYSESLQRGLPEFTEYQPVFGVGQTQYGWDDQHEKRQYEQNRNQYSQPPPQQSYGRQPRYPQQSYQQQPQPGYWNHDGYY